MKLLPNAIFLVLIMTGALLPAKLVVGDTRSDYLYFEVIPDLEFNQRFRRFEPSPAFTPVIGTIIGPIYIFSQPSKDLTPVDQVLDRGMIALNLRDFPDNWPVTRASQAYEEWLSVEALSVGPLWSNPESGLVERRPRFMDGSLQDWQPREEPIFR